MHIFFKLPLKFLSPVLDNQLSWYFTAECIRFTQFKLVSVDELQRNKLTASIAGCSDFSREEFDNMHEKLRVCIFLQHKDCKWKDYKSEDQTVLGLNLALPLIMVNYLTSHLSLNALSVERKL